MSKSPDAFRTISEVAAWLETPAHVLRFWESKFPQIKPVKRAGGRRYYRPDDMALLSGIKVLLHEQGMTIRGVQKLLREKGARHVASLSALPWSGEEAEGTEEAALDPWPHEVGDEVDAEEAEAGDPAPAPSLLDEFLTGTLSRLAAASEPPEEPTPPDAAATEAEAASEVTVARLLAAVERADRERLRERADRIVPLLARLAALREGPRAPGG